MSSCIHVLLADEGGSIEPVEPPRYGPGRRIYTFVWSEISHKSHPELNAIADSDGP